MPELTLLIDTSTGELTGEGDPAALTRLLPGPSTPVNCGMPVTRIAPLRATPGAQLRVARVYYGSVVDGPGRRTVLQVQGCPIRCAGCYVPQTWDAGGGVPMTRDDVLAALLSPAGAPMDGVTILGGEPTAQAAELLPIVRTLVDVYALHLVLYTGYTVEALARRGNPDVLALLQAADLVIDGPYIAKRAAGAGQWKGSTNQRVLTMADVGRLTA